MFSVTGGTVLLCLLLGAFCPESRYYSGAVPWPKLKGRAVNSQINKNVTWLFFLGRHLALSFG